MAKIDMGMDSMDESAHQDIASKDGSASGGNFKNDTNRASKAGKKGAAAQPRSAKAKGGSK